MLLVFLILAQVVLLVLAYGAHVLHHVSPWLIWLPAILLAVLVFISLAVGGAAAAFIKKSL